MTFLYFESPGHLYPCCHHKWILEPLLQSRLTHKYRRRLGGIKLLRLNGICFDLVCFDRLGFREFLAIEGLSFPHCHCCLVRMTYFYTGWWLEGIWKVLKVQIVSCIHHRFLAVSIYYFQVNWTSSDGCKLIAFGDECALSFVFRSCPLFFILSVIFSYSYKHNLEICLELLVGFF